MSDAAPRPEVAVRRPRFLLAVLLFGLVLVGTWLAISVRASDAQALDLGPVAPVVGTVNTVAAPVTNTVATLTTPPAPAPVVDTTTPPVVQAVAAPLVQAVAAPVTPIVQAVTAPIAPVIQAVAGPIAPVVNAVAAPIAPLVGGVVAPVAPLLPALTAPLTPVIAPLLPATTPLAPVVGAIPAPVPALVPVPGPGPSSPATPTPTVSDDAAVVPQIPAVVELRPIAAEAFTPGGTAADTASSATAAELPLTGGPAPSPSPARPSAPFGPSFPASSGDSSPHRGDGPGPVLAALPPMISPPALQGRRLGLLGASRPSSRIDLLLEQPG